MATESVASKREDSWKTAQATGHIQQHYVQIVCIVETESGGIRKRTGGEVKGKKANGGGSQQSCPVSDTVYPALLPLMRILRLLAAD